MRRALPATGAVVALVVVGAGAYATGHHTGMAAGRNAGRSSALAGLGPGDVQLIRQLTADRAVAAPSASPTFSPPAAQLDCARPGTMAKSNRCAGLTGAGSPPPAAGSTPGPAAASSTLTAALPAAGAYLAWLRSHPMANEPLLLTRLISAKVSLPTGAAVSLLAGPAGDDADGLVQLAYRGADACVNVRKVEAAPGQCYDGGSTQDTKGGDYSPKRYPPGYVAAE